MLSVDAVFTRRPSCIFWRQPPPPPRLLSPTLPPPIQHSLQQLTSRHACVNAPCLDRKLFFIWIIMGLLGLEKCPAFVVFEIFSPWQIVHICLDWNKIYQKKITQHNIILALSTRPSVPVSLFCSTFSNNVAFCLHLCMFKYTNTHRKHACSLDGSFAQGEDMVMDSTYWPWSSGLNELSSASPLL